VPKPVWNMDKELQVKHINDFSISPDGDRVVATIRSYGDEVKPSTKLWMSATALKGKKVDSRAWTHGASSDRAAQFSPDGRQLAFISRRAHPGFERQGEAIYLFPLEGGEPTLLHFPEGALVLLQWSPDAKKIYYTCSDKAPEPGKNDEVLRGKNLLTVRLYELDVATGKSRKISRGSQCCHEFSIAPNGKQAVVLTTRSAAPSDWYAARLHLVDLKTGQMKLLYKPRLQMANPIFAPDSKAVLLVTGPLSDQGMVSGDLLEIDCHSGQTRNLSEGHDLTVIAYRYHPAGKYILFLCQQAHHQSLGRLDRASGRLKILHQKTGLVAMGDFDRTGKQIVFSRTAHDRPADLYLATVDALGRSQQISDFNAGLIPPAFGEVESLRWKSSDGQSIDGFLYRPRGRAGRPAKTVVIAHGGPSGVSVPTWHRLSLARSFLMAGYQVFFPNFRGSTGHGNDFTEANFGDMGGMDLQDILSGVEYLEKTGKAPRNQFALWGWSYGGFMAAWTVTQTTKFKAAMMGAGVSNWVSFHGLTNINAWDDVFWRSSAIKNLAQRRERSAITHVARVKTPTLIIHGEKDLCVPVGQAHEFHQALSELKVATECMIYPRAGHGPQEREHVRDIHERSVRWFKRYLG